MSEYRDLSWKLQASMYDDFDVIEEKRRRMLTFKGYNSPSRLSGSVVQYRQVSAAFRLVRQQLRQENE